MLLDLVKYFKKKEHGKSVEVSYTISTSVSTSKLLMKCYIAGVIVPGILVTIDLIMGRDEIQAPKQHHMSAVSSQLELRCGLAVTCWSVQ